MRWCQCPGHRTGMPGRPGWRRRCRPGRKSTGSATVSTMGRRVRRRPWRGPARRSICRPARRGHSGRPSGSGGCADSAAAPGHGGGGDPAHRGAGPGGPDPDRCRGGAGGGGGKCRGDRSGAGHRDQPHRLVPHFRPSGCRRRAAGGRQLAAAADRHRVGHGGGAGAGASAGHTLRAYRDRGGRGDGGGGGRGAGHAGGGRDCAGGSGRTRRRGARAARCLARGGRTPDPVCRTAYGQPRDFGIRWCPGPAPARPAQPGRPRSWRGILMGAAAGDPPVSGRKSL